MVSPEPQDRPSGEILKSNIDSVQPVAQERPRRGVGVLPLVLAGALLFVLGVGAALLFASMQSRPRQVAIGAAPRSTAFSAPVPGVTGGGGGSSPEINGISCDALEATIVHVHVHLAIFVNGQEQQIPFGIGIAQPWQVAAAGEMIPIICRIFGRSSTLLSRP